MKTITTVIFTLMIFTFAGCGSRDESPQQKGGSQETVSVPKMDLFQAVFTDNLDIINRHIKAGSDVNVMEPSRKSTPLISTAFLGKTEAAKLLIDAGADLNYQNLDGSTALHTSTVFGKIDISKLLIDAGTKLNIQNNEGSTALHTAAFFCRVEIVNALLEKGADKNLKNKTGKTALEITEIPFEYIKGVYDAVGEALRPLGLKLDYDRIKTTRPKIAEMLK